jgi:hypothetical protein
MAFQLIVRWFFAITPLERILTILDRKMPFKDGQVIGIRLFDFYPIMVQISNVVSVYCRSNHWNIRIFNNGSINKNY